MCLSVSVGYLERKRVGTAENIIPNHKVSIKKVGVREKRLTDGENARTTKL